MKAVSRPGVFSHRHIDPGARRLLDAAEVAAGERVLDIGCGAGAVGLALAAREPSLAVHAVDSHVRAVDCTAAGALLNGLSNVTVELNCRGDYLGAGAFDLAVANPPYYADFRIAELFIAAAQRNLRDGGRLILVTKQGERLAAALGAGWDDVEVFDAKGYVVGRARKRRC